MTAGTDNLFEFELKSDALLPATMVVTPTLTPAAGAALGWATAVLDASQSEIPSRQVTIQPKRRRALHPVAILPARTHSVPLGVSAVGGGLRVAGTLDLRGQNAPDPDIQMKPSPSDGVSERRSRAAGDAPTGQRERSRRVGTYTVT